MAYFIPSSIQKRLLRYALSRLELLDTDTLDLERLEIGWGRRSTVELQDVTLRKEKLARLLSLPDSLSVQHAIVGQLRVTVPADLHTSSIIVEISKVEVRVKLQEDDDLHQAKASGSGSREKGGRSSSHGRARRRSRDRSQRGHTRTDALPDPKDLAKSFLDEEPAEERAQLQAAINSQSVDLRASGVSSDAGGDDAVPGVGVGLGLPSFLASFLKSVGDRLQVMIKDVTINLDAFLDVSSEEAVQPSRPAPAPTTVCLVIDDLCVQDASLTHSPNPQAPEETYESPPPHAESLLDFAKRRVTLNGITSYLISDAAIFAQLSQVFEKPSGATNPIASMNSAKTLSTDVSCQGSVRRSNHDQPERSLEASIDSLDLEAAQWQDLDSMMARSRLTDNESAQQSFMASSPHRIDSAHPAQLDLMTDETSTSQHLSDDDALGAADNSRLNLQDSLTRFREERTRWPDPQATEARRKRALYSPPTTPPRSPRTNPLARSPSRDMPGTFRTQTIQPGSSQGSSPEAHFTDPDHVSSDPETPLFEDLAQSHYFSHEEAESIYMSAIHDSAESSTALPRMPGQWDETVDPDMSRHPNTTTKDLATQSMPRPSTSSSMGRTNFSATEESSSRNNKSPSHSHRITPSHQAESLFRSPDAVRKKIMSISTIQVCLSEDRTEGAHLVSTFDAEASRPRPARSQSDMPGGLSQYAASSASMFPSEVLPQQVGSPQGRHEPGHGSTSIDVEVGIVDVGTDLAICKVVSRLCTKITSLFDTTGDSTCTASKSVDVCTGSASASSGSLSAKRVNVSFMDTVPSSRPHVHQFATEADVSDEIKPPLLRLSILDTSLHLGNITRPIKGTLELGRASVRLQDQDLLSFSQEKAMRTSVDELPTIRDKDIRVELNVDEQRSETSIWMQSLNVRMNMHQIDGTLESIGGLSGLLELSSSIMSDSTIISRSKQPQPPTRMVRFETPTDTATSKCSTPESKVNIHSSGARLTLQGECCSVALQASSTNIVRRDAYVAVKTGEIRAGGPTLRGSMDSTPLYIVMYGIELRYLYAPDERDLTRLIEVLTPSNNRFEEEDDFLVDTLMKQRKKGAVLRANVKKVELHCEDLQRVETLQELAQEMSKLSSVTKYLPQETRPGLLTLGSIGDFAATIDSGTKLGQLSIRLKRSEVAHINAPGLVASAVRDVSVRWEDGDQDLIHALVTDKARDSHPMLMARMIEDELEPIVKIKLWNICVEYSVPLVEALMAMHDSKAQEHSTPKASDVPMSNAGRTVPETTTHTTSESKPLQLDIAFRDSAVGLTPRSLSSKALFMLNDAEIVGTLPDGDVLQAQVHFRKAELLIIDDVSRLASADISPGRSSSTTGSTPVSRDLCRKGFVNVCSISAATIRAKVSQDDTSPDRPSNIDIEMTDELFVLETCADSTQTLLETMNGLKPPVAPSKGVRYRTEVAPVEDLMASFLGDAFAVPSKPKGRNSDTQGEEDEESTEGVDDEDFDPLNDSSDPEHDFSSDPGDDALEESIYGGFGLQDFQEIEEAEQSPTQRLRGAVAASPRQMHESILGSLQLAQLPPQIHGKAKRFDSNNNRYVPVSKTETARCPVKVHVKDMHIIWNLYDGYDWERTRDTITQAVHDVEARAEEKRKSRRAVVDNEEDDESVIGDCLFNSIYIGVPIKGETKDISKQINHDIDDMISETASRTASNAPSRTSTATSRPSSSHQPRTPGRKLKLDRSKRHKIAFELRGLAADSYMFPPGEETQSSTDVRISEFEIFDLVPTSTWKKFATYMHDAGPREDKKPMIHLEICDVRPVADLTATELVVRATVLPLRLHVDQDALDFITRFFGFKDSEKPQADTTQEQPFLQRVEVLSIPVKMDYKPHRVDFAGLRSGRTKEFMNFVVLDGSDFILRHVCLYGVTGLDKMHDMLEDIWMADVKSRQQLPGVLSGVNGVRTLVNMGTGMRDLVQIPIHEYRKDGRIVRSISKGALAFGRTTGGELTRFGAKLAVGAQRALQGAEGMLLGPSSRQDQGWEEADLDPEEKRAFSHYANQPMGVLQGLKGAARSLERDLLVTRDVIIAISGEVRESGSVEGAARAVARHAPTLILRPMIGASKAVGQTMMGATNSVDPANRRRMEDVSIVVFAYAPIPLIIECRNTNAIDDCTSEMIIWMPPCSCIALAFWLLAWNQGATGHG